MPSGIDRVELAYARHFVAQSAERVTFMQRGMLGQMSIVPPQLVAELVDAVTQLWQDETERPETLARARRLARSTLGRQWIGAGNGQIAQALRGPEPQIHLLVSHRLIEKPGMIAALKRQGALFVPLVHDLIPATYPEYAPPESAARHVRRIEAIAALADGIITNSAATAAALSAHLPEGPARPPVLVAPLGVEQVTPDASFPLPDRPYFVCLGTIEPRKNHLLLLNIWRDLANKLGPSAPRLILIGRRGWENENVIDMLERCTVLRGLVREYADLSDSAVAALLKGAQALLFPSFAEGYGLPLAEALALGLPAICSDLPALREVGGAAPEYLDPLDGIAWRRLILHFTEAENRVRAAQLRRITEWDAPRWADHFALVDPMLRHIADGRGAAQRKTAPAQDPVAFLRPNPPLAPSPLQRR